MAPLDNGTAQQDTLTLLDQQLRGERLSIESEGKEWPLGKAVFLVLVSGFVLWAGVYYMTSG